MDSKKKLGDVLDRVDQRSLSQLVHDHAAPRRPIGHRNA
jgi:hypothetical protein